jgi:hypothetical protein
MRQHPIVTSIFASTLLASAAVADASAQEGPTSLLQCQQDLQRCVLDTPLSEAFQCPAKFRDCAAVVAVNVAAPLVSAISDAADCTRTELRCTADASTPPKAALCAEDQAQCVASIVGVELPGVVEGTTKCVDTATDCILFASSPADLAKCGADLRSCAVDQLESTLPESVATVIDEVQTCDDQLRGCIEDSSAPSELTACNEKRLTCQAGAFGVELPELHGSDLVKCGEDAQQCGLHVGNGEDVVQCGMQLRDCVAGVAGQVGKEALTCEQKWTACIRENPTPGGFFYCGAQIAGCTDD